MHTRILPGFDPENAVRLARIRVVLCRPSHPGNIGATARAMKTMGLSRLYLVAPKRFPDPEADARAAGATDLLAGARVCANLDEALAGTCFSVALSARRREIGPQPQAPREAAARLFSVTSEGEGALVFGNESAGLTNEEVLRCPALTAIPADPAFSSLNLGAAVQVLCYELRMAALGLRPDTEPVLPLASHAEQEGFYAHLEEVMTRTGFYNPEQPGRLLPKLRRLFGRARLEREEINLLRGILAATQKPTRHGAAGEGGRVKASLG